MSNIVKPLTNDNTYFGLVKIDLRPLWINTRACNLNGALLANACREYNSLRDWLINTELRHKFFWHDTGAYLPTYLYLEEDSAIYFKLKYTL
jgi:hypothetical protein